jgi:predicted ABC-type ATPase
MNPLSKGQTHAVARKSPRPSGESSDPYRDRGSERGWQEHPDQRKSIHLCVNPSTRPGCICKNHPFNWEALSPIAAGREVLRLTEEHLKRRQSFAVETTLSGQNYLKMMRYARGIGRGFEVTLIYIGTESVEINLARIAERVRAGGHNVPEIDVRRRYLRSLDNLPLAVKNADHVLLFDNSHEQGYQLVGVLSRNKCEWFSPLPSWVAELKATFA